MQVGGYLGTGAAVTHTVAGALHAWGGAGSDNLENGGAILAVGIILGRSASAFGPSALLPGMSFAQRQAHELAKRTGVMVGLTYDLGENILPVEPQKVTCEKR